jgi:hypothetical protein
MPVHLLRSLQLSHATDNWVLRCVHDTTSTRVGNHIPCKEAFQCGEISCLGCGYEGIEEESPPPL